MIKTLIVFLCATLTFPFTIFADTAATTKAEIKLNLEQAQFNTAILSRAIHMSGIRFYNSLGEEVTLSQLHRSGSQDNRALKIAIPEMPQLGLKKPFGFYFHVLSYTPEHVSAFVSFTNGDFSQVLSSGMIHYNLSMTPLQNKTEIDSQLQKIFSAVPKTYFTKNSPGEKSLSEKVAQFFLPKAQAEASDVIWNGVTRLWYLVTGISFAAIMAESFHALKLLPLGSKLGLIIGMLFFANVGAGYLLKTFSLDNGCFNESLLSQVCTAQLGNVITGGFFMDDCTLCTTQLLLKAKAQGLRL